jgi:chromosomal replication initiation ATPase DnaA
MSIGGHPIDTGRWQDDRSAGKPSTPYQPDPLTVEQHCERLMSKIKPVSNTAGRTTDHNELIASIIDERLREIGVPKRFVEASDLETENEWFKTLENLCAKLGTGFMVGMIGERGPGKTQMACELLRACLANKRSGLYCTATGFFMDIKEGYAQDKSEKEIITNYSKPSLLVIDELGQRSESDWENRLLFELLNRRYGALKDTLVISNHKLQDLESSLSDSIVSRMRETGGIICCAWPSFRK